MPAWVIRTTFEPRSTPSFSAKPLPITAEGVRPVSSRKVPSVILSEQDPDLDLAFGQSADDLDTGRVGRRADQSRGEQSWRGAAHMIADLGALQDAFRALCAVGAEVVQLADGVARARRLDDDVAAAEPDAGLDHAFVHAVAEAERDDEQEHADRERQRGQQGSPGVAPQVAPAHPEQ